jgi:hypothetical protein
MSTENNMSGNLETLAFFRVTTCQNVETKVYAGSELKAVRRAFPELDAEFFFVKKLTYASGGKVRDPDLQLVRGPRWPKDGSGDERVYNMMYGVEQANVAIQNAQTIGDVGEEGEPTLAELAQEEQERMQLDVDFAQAGMTELDKLNDEEAARCMNEEDACHSMGADLSIRVIADDISARADLDEGRVLLREIERGL